MGKSANKRKNKVRRAPGGKGVGRQAPNLHPVVSRAMANGARLERGTYEVTAVPNPTGEVIIRGEVRRHKAVRRVPHFETLYRSKVIDRTVFACLEWYADRLALAQSGLFKCGLDVSGAGGGSAQHHIPTTQAAMEARSDVEWARGFVPSDLQPIFDGVMVDGESFDAIGRSVYPHVSRDDARKKVSSAFKIAANHLLLGIGDRLICNGRAT